MADKDKKGLDRLESQLSFCLEIDKEKEIGRQTRLADGSRYENDAEHAWHMAIMAWLLREYANEEIDIARTMMMILTHDLVEVYAGDTYAYDEEGKKTQRQREEAAANRLYRILPEDQGHELRTLWEEFDAGLTPEARFARTMDNMQPMMLNIAADGIAWREKSVHLSQVMERNSYTHEGSETLWSYMVEHYLKPSVEKGHLITEESPEDRPENA